MQTLKLSDKMKVIDIAPKEDKTCNGFSNWATFAAVLACDNTLGVYKDFCRLARNNDASPEECKKLFFEHFPNGTVDMDVGKDIFDIDWEEFADHMNAE